MIARELIALSPIAQDVEEGLTSNPKTLPSKLFYDAEGSSTVRRNHSAAGILSHTYRAGNSARAWLEMMIAAGPSITVVELGAGTATKTCTLLQALSRRQMRVKYFPVDISPAALAEARERVEAECPLTQTCPVVADMSEGFRFF